MQNLEPDPIEKPVGQDPGQGEQKPCVFSRLISNPVPPGGKRMMNRLSYDIGRAAIHFSRVGAASKSLEHFSILRCATHVPGGGHPAIAAQSQCCLFSWEADTGRVCPS